MFRKCNIYSTLYDVAKHDLQPSKHHVNVLKPRDNCVQLSRKYFTKRKQANSASLMSLTCHTRHQSNPSCTCTFPASPRWRHQCLSRRRTAPCLGGSVSPRRRCIGTPCTGGRRWAGRGLAGSIRRCTCDAAKKEEEEEAFMRVFMLVINQSS